MKYQRWIASILMSIMIVGLMACAPTVTDDTNGEATAGAGQEETPASTNTPDSDESETLTPEPSPTVVSEESEVEDMLVGTRWTAVSYLAPEGIVSPVEGSEITLDFEEGHVVGNTGCNSYFGLYSLAEGNAISVAQIGQTEMFCEATMDQESAFLTALAEAESYTLNEDELIIHTAAGDLTFEPAQDASLEGPRWQLSGIVDVENQSVSSAAVDALIYLQFEDGGMSGFGSCNAISTQYTLDGNEITFGPLAITRRACDMEKNEREAEFVEALSAVAMYEVDRNVLHLLDAEGERRLSFVVADESETTGNIDIFLQQLDMALANREYEALEALAADEVAIGPFRSEWSTLDKQAWLDQMTSYFLPEGATVTISGPDTDISALLDGMDPQAMLGPDVDVEAVRHSSGWMADGAGEVILWVERQDDGQLALKAMLYAPMGFNK